MLAVNLDPEPGGEKSAEDKGVPDKEIFRSFNVLSFRPLTHRI